ncbi:hypothetical protein DFH29DRAFT_957099, partial [Suillus ampliporus]
TSAWRDPDSCERAAVSGRGWQRRGQKGGQKGGQKVGGNGRPKVLADGTYATETAYTSTGSARLEAVKAASKPPL